MNAANEIKFSRETSKLYEKISNIAKLYVLTNLTKVFPERTVSKPAIKTRNIYEEQEISLNKNIKNHLKIIVIFNLIIKKR